MEDDVKQSGQERYALSQAYRWRAERDKAMQELRQLKDSSRDTAVSAYDLMPEEDREAAEWVRGHGGLDEVRRDFQDAYNRRSELCAALGIDLDTGWSDAMAELDRRLMPAGYEWPRFESGELVRSGDRLIDDNGDWFRAVSFIFTCDWWCIEGYQQTGFGTLSRETKRKLSGMPYGERVKRPAPKVLDADGVEIHVGDTVYHVKDGSEMTVYGIEGEWLVVSVGSRARHDTVTHRAPVLAADGKPLREGETVWHVGNGIELTVIGLPRTGEYQSVRLRLDDGAVTGFDPDQLTHTKPEIDSWERIEEDAGCTAAKYNERRGTIFTTKQQVARDLVRRCKALAERERGE